MSQTIKVAFCVLILPLFHSTFTNDNHLYLYAMYYKTDHNISRQYIAGTFFSLKICNSNLI